jgi:hypothetical protein
MICSLSGWSDLLEARFVRTGTNICLRLWKFGATALHVYVPGQPVAPALPSLIHTTTRVLCELIRCANLRIASNINKQRSLEQLQQFDKPTYKNRNCARGWWLSSLFPSRWEGEKEIKNREGFLM